MNQLTPHKALLQPGDRELTSRCGCLWTPEAMDVPAGAKWCSGVRNKETKCTLEEELPLSSYFDSGDTSNKDEALTNKYYVTKDPSDKIDKYLILCHEQSGDFYTTKISEKPPAPNSIINLAPHSTETEMCVCFFHWLILLLHAASGIVSLICCVYSLVGTLFSDQCLPNLVDSDGTPLRYTHGFSAMCNTAVVGFGVICVLNFTSVVTVNWYIKRPSLVLLSFLLTVAMAAFLIFGGSIFTAHFLLWCDSISHAVPGHQSDDCSVAAKLFDDYYKATNMTAFHTEMQTQQVLLWTMLPIAAMTIIAYSLVLRFKSRDIYETLEEDEDAPSGFFRILATLLARDDAGSDYSTNGGNDERVPFLYR